MSNTFKFGKYRENTLKEVFKRDKHYIEWLMTQDWYKKFHEELYKESLSLIKNHNPKLSDEIFTVYTDGACSNNGYQNARSAYGIYFPEKNKIKISNISQQIESNEHSNNIAELTAIFEALKIIKDNKINLPIHLYTDSSYCLKILIEWYEKWVRNDLLKGKKNLDLIKDTYDIYKTMNVNIQHIKAHTRKNDEHSYGNRMADQLATSAFNRRINNKISSIS